MVEAGDGDGEVGLGEGEGVGVGQLVFEVAGDEFGEDDGFAAAGDAADEAGGAIDGDADELLLFVGEVAGFGGEFVDVGAELGGFDLGADGAGWVEGGGVAKDAGDGFDVVRV